jgi:hypothetical protein
MIQQHADLENVMIHLQNLNNVALKRVLSVIVIGVLTLAVSGTATGIDNA